MVEQGGGAGMQVLHAFHIRSHNMHPGEWGVRGRWGGWLGYTHPGAMRGLAATAALRANRKAD